MSYDGGGHLSEAGGAFGVGMKRFLDIWTGEKTGSSGEKLTRKAIDEYTWEKLEDTVSFAVANSPFYREKIGKNAAYQAYENGRATFEEIFAGLPFTTGDELRERGIEFLCVSPGVISRIVTLDTGGTTGKPKRIFFTEEDQDLTVDYFRNGMQLLTDSSDRILILMPAGAPGSIGRLLAEAVEGFGAVAEVYGLPSMIPPLDGRAENAEEAAGILELMKKKGVTSVVAVPTHMRMLAEEALRQNRETGTQIPHLRTVLLSAEYVKEEDSRITEEVFGCRVYEHYGMTEMGLGCAVSCGCGRGYHVRESDLYLEIIDPDTGRAAPPGETGEIVFTTLTRKGMPFIRYRTGDMSRWINESCPCGSILKRLDKVGERKEIKGYLR